MFLCRQKLCCFFLNRVWLTTTEFSSMLMHHLVPHFYTLQCCICAHFMFSAKLKVKKNRLERCITSISHTVLLLSWMAFLVTKKWPPFSDWRPFLNLNLAFKILYGSREKNLIISVDVVLTDCPPCTGHKELPGPWVVLGGIIHFYHFQLLFPSLATNISHSATVFPWPPYSSKLIVRGTLGILLCFFFYVLVSMKTLSRDSIMFLALVLKGEITSQPVRGVMHHE